MSKAPTPKKPVPIERKNNPLWIGLTVVTGAICLIPVAGQAWMWATSGISHIGDRVANGGKANDEIKLRANYYRNIVAAKLGMDPAKVGVNEFLMVSRSDPTFNKIVQDVYATRDRANRESLLTNGGIAAVSTFVPALGAAAKIGSDVTKVAKVAAHAKDIAFDVAKIGSGLLAGTAASSIFNKDKISAQEVVERIDQCLLDAQQSGKPSKGAVTPQLVFLLRVAQDEKFADEIKTRFGKPYQKLEPEQQLLVMQSYPQLANAVTSEAYAVSNGMMTPQDLAAKAPNLNATANQYAVGAQNSSFVDALRAQRTQAAANPSQALAT